MKAQLGETGFVNPFTLKLLGVGDIFNKSTTLYENWVKGAIQYNKNKSINYKHK